MPNGIEAQVTSADDALIPPSEALFDGSTSRDEFVRVGEGFLRHVLVGRALLAPASAFLDLGCGNGSIARPLTSYLSAEGRYEGMDISTSSIEWLNERYRPYPNFHFTHADVFNKMYNPQGQHVSRDYRFPFADATFDMVLLKSVFTHMLPCDVRNYLSEVSRVLKPGGRAVTTWFLLNEASRRLIDQGRDTMGLRFEHDADPLCRVANPDVPENVVAHDEGRVYGMCSDAGLSVAELSYGDWCGRPTLVGLQDAIIAIKNG